MLESKGVIEPVGNGTFVVAELRSPLNRSFALLLSLDEANLSELYELRRMLEGEAAALAAARRSEQDIATMARAPVACWRWLSRVRGSTSGCGPRSPS